LIFQHGFPSNTQSQPLLTYPIPSPEQPIYPKPSSKLKSYTNTSSIRCIVISPLPNLDTPPMSTLPRLGIKRQNSSLSQNLDFIKKIKNKTLLTLILALTRTLTNPNPNSWNRSQVREFAVLAVVVRRDKARTKFVWEKGLAALT